MPKDKIEEPKKKVVVVEEIDSSEPTEVEETSSDVKTEVVDNETVVQEKDPKVSTQQEQKPIIQDQLTIEDKPNYLWIIVPTALLVGALVGGLITYFSGVSKMNVVVESPTPVSTVLPSLTPVPSSSPSSALKRETLKVQVLNGSGVSGLANKAKTYLEGLGYKDVATGNASSSDYTETEIQIKDTKKEFLETITTDLSKNYTLKKDTKALSASSKYDIIITLGKK